jgi:hypothetical protein
MELNKTKKKALNAALKAMDEWQAELVELTERRSSEVFDKLTDVAQALGWPAEMVETSKDQLLQASKTQTEMMRHMVEGWRSNLEASNGLTIEPTTNTIGHALTAPPVDLAKFATVLPQFWVQTMGIWQKNWSDAMGLWMGSSEKAERINRRQGEHLNR